MNIKTVSCILALATLAGCTSLNNLDEESRAALQAKQRAGKVDHVSFEDLKDSMVVLNTQDPQ